MHGLAWSSAARVAGRPDQTDTTVLGFGGPVVEATETGTQRPKPRPGSWYNRRTRGLLQKSNPAGTVSAENTRGRDRPCIRGSTRGLLGGTAIRLIPSALCRP